MAHASQGLQARAETSYGYLEAKTRILKSLYKQIAKLD